MPCNSSMTQAALIKCYGNLILKHSQTFLSLCFTSYQDPFNGKGFRMSHALAFLIKMSSLRVYLHTQHSFLCFLQCARADITRAVFEQLLLTQLQQLRGAA